MPCLRRPFELPHGEEPEVSTAALVTGPVLTSIGQMFRNHGMRQKLTVRLKPKGARPTESLVERQPQNSASCPARALPWSCPA